MSGYHIIITRPDVEMLEKEIPILIQEWGITSCKLFMTFEGLHLRDGEILDVMLTSQRNGMTTVSLVPYEELFIFPSSND
jgi:dihydropyrimidinase